MPDFKAEASSTGSRASAPGSDVGAPKSGRLNVRVLLAIVAVAIAVKLAFFGLSAGTSMSFAIPNAENWQDFWLAYVPSVGAFKGGFLPYSDFFYAYPPLYHWALTAFSYLPLPLWSSAFPLVGADALTVVPLYLIARELANERVSRLLSVLFIVSPTNLYYADYLWLNPPLTTLFLMTSVYLLIRGRYGWSALALALSIGLKQTALFALPVMLFIVWKKGPGKATSVKYFVIVSAACLAFSLPYMVYNSPLLYFDSIFRLPFNGVPLPSDYFQIGVGGGTRVTFDTSNWITSRWALLSAGVYSPATLALPFFIFLVPTASFGFYSSALLSGAMMIPMVAGFALILRSIWKRAQIDEEAILGYILYSLLVVFTFYPFYKYYIVGIVPFLVLLVRDRKGAVGFAAFSFALMLLPRYSVSWLLLLSLIWLVRRGMRSSSRGVPPHPQTLPQEPSLARTRSARLQRC